MIVTGVSSGFAGPGCGCGNGSGERGGSGAGAVMRDLAAEFDARSTQESRLTRSSV